MRRISTGTLARVPVGALGGNKAAAEVPSTAITESLAERRSAAAPAVFGTPLLTIHFVNLAMQRNARLGLAIRRNQPLPIGLAGRFPETPGASSGQLVSDEHPLSVSRAIGNPIGREDVLPPFGYLGASFGKREKGPAPAQLYLRQKSALHGAEKFYKPEEFEQLLVDLRGGLISVSVYDEGIIIDRPARREAR